MRYGPRVARPFSLIVTDTSPLFTLVLAGSLDALRQRQAGDGATTRGRLREQLRQRRDAPVPKR